MTASQQSALSLALQQAIVRCLSGPLFTDNVNTLDKIKQIAEETADCIMDDVTDAIARGDIEERLEELPS
jgi:hypothetical protein